MMKIYNISEFKKLPTSENEASESTVTKNSFKDDLKDKESFSFFNNIWLIIFFIIFGLIFILWISTEFYWILFEYDIITEQSKLTIIINIFDKKHNLTHLLRSLMQQSISSYEIIITKNFKSNYSETPFSKFKRKNVNIKIIQFSEKDTNLKIRVDSVSAASGEYIIFLNSDEYLPTNILSDCLKTTIKKNIDITQYNYFHDDIFFGNILHQPRLFDSMFLDKDSIKQKQFHLTGKIIKKSIFINAMKDIDNFYLENNNNVLFEESMIILKLFKKAESFIKLQYEDISNECEKNKCPQKLIDKKNYTKNEINDILIYLKFLIQYTDNKALEKRMASQFFIEMLVQKPISEKNYNKNLIELLDEIIDLYSNCDFINEYDINLIKDYRKKIIAQ